MHRVQLLHLGERISPVIAFAVSMLAFEMALLTYFTREGRWKLLHLYRSLREIRSLRPHEFEQLVGAAYEQVGYAVAYANAGKDAGVDLVLSRRSERVVVQCKNWYRAFTGVREVRELFGALHATHATRAIFVTSGVFSEDAIGFASENSIELVDGEALLDMVDAVHDSVSATAVMETPTRSTDNALELNRDKRCLICGSPTVRRTARRGANAGTSFWSCSRFPDCFGVAAD